MLKKHAVPNDTKNTKRTLFHLCKQSIIQCRVFEMNHSIWRDKHKEAQTKRDKNSTRMDIVNS